MNIKVVIIENLRQIQIDMIHRSYRNRSRKSSLRGQGRVLNILLENGDITRSELGDILHMSRPALAELLGKMEREGLIIRSRSEKDKRRIDIKLTQAGREEAELTELGHSSLPSMLDCLDIEELNQLNGYLERIIEQNHAEDKGGQSEQISEGEAEEIAENVVDTLCQGCRGPEYCRHDYKKYGHDRPNPDYCKYADQFPF